MNFSTNFFTYVSSLDSGLPFTSSSLYGGLITTSLNTTIFGPRQVTCKHTHQVMYSVYSVEKKCAESCIAAHWRPYLIDCFRNIHIELLAFGTDAGCDSGHPSPLLFDGVADARVQLQMVQWPRVRLMKAAGRSGRAHSRHTRCVLALTRLIFSDGGCASGTFSASFVTCTSLHNDKFTTITSFSLDALLGADSVCVGKRWEGRRVFFLFG